MLPNAPIPEVSACAQRCKSSLHPLRVAAHSVDGAVPLLLHTRAAGEIVHDVLHRLPLRGALCRAPAHGAGAVPQPHRPPPGPHGLQSRQDIPGGVGRGDAPAGVQEAVLLQRAAQGRRAVVVCGQDRLLRPPRRRVRRRKGVRAGPGGAAARAAQVPRPHGAAAEGAGGVDGRVRADAHRHGQPRAEQRGRGGGGHVQGPPRPRKLLRPRGQERLASVGRGGPPRPRRHRRLAPADWGREGGAQDAERGGGDAARRAERGRAQGQDTRPRRGTGEGGGVGGGRGGGYPARRRGPRPRRRPRRTPPLRDGAVPAGQGGGAAGRALRPRPSPGEVWSGAAAVVGARAALARQRSRPR
mmetsp:Transcript_55886/g.116919  ORF Transcript_55886/g.116919 Transcript_55886/m.116919 type:complete len:356 (-) Transcript_55886:234-1301(-)